MTDDEHLGLTAEDQREICYSQAIHKLGEQQGLHAWDYQLWVAEQLGHDVSHIRAENRRTIAKHLGIDDF
ncbi:hypothetical protein PSCICM_26680 [Pseudomonas cichorii]|uniref:hypothetical protein n=1 Tax=Pseudomonas cichorii TaxID=36746 RepID=UPI001910181C|nr:hypothetical protein [Pseudomonas cichorii]GFM76849.1 hypothetical protein PSCICM_26680 [Pseudomonas cichorii]